MCHSWGSRAWLGIRDLTRLYLGSDDKRHSESQAGVSELWLSWGEWNCGINILKAGGIEKPCEALLVVPLMGPCGPLAGTLWP